MILEAGAATSFDWSCFQKFDFYFFLFLTLIGIGFSIASFVEAKRAKIAAQEAGKIVKIQDILLEISEITNMAFIDINDNYQRASDRIKTFSGKINYIIAILKNEVYIDTAELSDIMETLKAIRNKLNQLNPIIAATISGGAENNISGLIYYSLESDLVNLNAQMNKLAGELHRNIINNNK
jgi:hypothetical protein